MVHKNLRTLLYYVVGVTAVCLMIEVTTDSLVLILVQILSDEFLVAGEQAQLWTGPCALCGRDGRRPQP